MIPIISNRWRTIPVSESRVKYTKKIIASKVLHWATFGRPYEEILRENKSLLRRVYLKALESERLEAQKKATLEGTSDD